MSPTFQPGDRLLVVRSRRAGPGDLVVVPDPRPGGKVLLKRVEGLEGRSLTLTGDNPTASTDSRLFGPVPRRTVLGRPVYRYGPAGRVGRLSRGGARHRDA